MSYTDQADGSNLANVRNARVGQYRRIDHIAIAVRNLDEAINFYTNVLGFQLMRRRKIEGQRGGMISAELEHHGISFVLCEGVGKESQVSQLIENFGPGVAHIALEVDDIQASVNWLSDRGMKFDTSIIGGANSTLQQIFTSRDRNSGIAFELIKRSGGPGFEESNVNELFSQLEKAGNY